MPDQAVLLDLPHERFYFFNLELWPQDIYLPDRPADHGARSALFLVTSLVGRVWCGYTCPQTVWTDLFMWVERRDRRRPQRAHEARRGAADVDTVWRKIAEARGLAGHRVLDRRRLDHVLRRCADGDVEFWRGSAVGRGLFLHRPVHRHHLPAGRLGARAGVHLHVPVAALPGGDAGRAEPAPSPIRAGAANRAASGKRASARARRLGDCVDCGACVTVCPTGIDIRDGIQLECINCGLCIDACNHVMDEAAPAELADHLGHAGRPDGEGAGRARAAPPVPRAHHDLLSARWWLA